MQSQSQIADLFKQCSKDLFGVCFYVLKDETSSKDMVMDTFAVALQNPNFHKIENPRGWLMGVARNLSLKHFHTQKKLQYDLTAENISERFMENGSEEEHIYRNVLEEKLLEQIALLKPAQSRCIEMFYLGGESYQDIANAMSLEIKTVKSHIQNGKRNLYMRLKETRNNE